MSALKKALTQHDTPFSDEMVEKLEIYQTLLNKWQQKINLVSKASLADAAERHFLDSAQLLKYIPDQNIKLADMGAGAGFPGMVLAILGVADVHLIESDMRKCAFLHEVSRETKTSVTIHNCRIENCPEQGFDIVTARALAPFKGLISYLRPMVTSGGYGLFLKGVNYQTELDDTNQVDLNIEIYDSISSPDGKIIKVGFV